MKTIFKRVTLGLFLMLSACQVSAQTTACNVDPNELEPEFDCNVETMSCSVNLRLCFTQPTAREALPDGTVLPFDPVTELGFYEASFTTSGGSNVVQLLDLSPSSDPDIEYATGNIDLSITNADVFDDGRASIAATISAIDTTDKKSDPSNTFIVSGRFSQAFIDAIKTAAEAVIDLKLRLVLVQ